MDYPVPNFSIDLTGQVALVTGASSGHRRYRITEGSEEIQMRKVGAFLFGYLGPKRAQFAELKAGAAS